MIYVKPFFYVFGGLDSDPVANIGQVLKFDKKSVCGLNFQKLEKARFDPVYQDWQEIGRLNAPRFGHRIIFGRF